MARKTHRVLHSTNKTSKYINVPVEFISIAEGAQRLKDMKKVK